MNENTVKHAKTDKPRSNQASRNPFPNSDSNKRYYTYDYYLKKTFGSKCARIALDAGFTCPNIDGIAGRGGCIYCLNGSCHSKGDIISQYEDGAAAARRKWGDDIKFIPYLQAHTNTYAPVSRLRAVYDEAASLPGAVMLAAATRADCLSDEVISLLVEISEHIPLTVELGLQSVHDETAQRINRCHSYDDFLSGYGALRSAGGNIMIGVHIINGLPGEDCEMMLETARSVAELHPDMVKIHLLHVLRGTVLEKMYARGEYTPMLAEDYTDITVRQLEMLSPDTVIGRISGDAPEDLLVAPRWCLRKTAVANNIDKLMYARNTWQGRLHNSALGCEPYGI